MVLTDMIMKIVVSWNAMLCV